MNKHKVTIKSGLTFEGPDEFYHDVQAVATIGGLELDEARAIEAVVSEGGNGVAAKLGALLAEKVKA